jgi:type IV pilus assembly protein PilW
MRKRFPFVSPPRHAARGFTLMEMLVAMAVGLVVSLVLMSVLSMFEGRKRSAGSVSDIDNAGAYAASQLDHFLRSAGSGIAQASANAYGCQLQYTTILPLAGPLADPVFAAAKGAGSGTISSVTLAPVMILKGNTPNALVDQLLDAGNGSSDVLMVMGGSGGSSWAAPNVYTPFNGVANAASVTLQNTLPFAVNDLVLVMDTPGSTGPLPCALGQVTSVTQATATLGFNPAPTNLANYSVASAAVALGNVSAAAPNYPGFELIGVANGTAGGNNYSGLYMYDLLQLTATSSVPIADSVMELHALYGLAQTAGSEAVTCWQEPDGAFDSSVLSSGTTAAMASLAQIKAIRVGLILKSPLQEKTADTQTNGKNAEYSNAYTAPSTLTLFNDLAAAPFCSAPTIPYNPYTRTLSAAEQKYRYRTIEATIPLRNALLN